MASNGGYATLGFLYNNVLKIKDCHWGTKTPFASIRRIVQDDRYFFKIRPGLWALKAYKEKLPFDINITETNKKTENIEFNHTYYQGLLVEIGNLNNYETFVPAQDRNKKFLDKKLSDIATLQVFHDFSYENVVNKARTIDVSWFNNRKMPGSFFEIEFSTDMQNSLLKYVELQDFNTKFYIISDNARKKEYDSKINLNAFNPIKDRVKFIDYDKLSDWHTKTFELVTIERIYNV
jgi:hypothetical protein